MLQLEIAPNEVDAFREILDSNLSELGDEIAKTDSKDYRERLRLRRDLLKRVLGQLKQA